MVQYLNVRLSDPVGPGPSSESFLGFRRLMGAAGSNTPEQAGPRWFWSRPADPLTLLSWLTSFCTVFHIHTDWSPSSVTSCWTHKTCYLFCTVVLSLCVVGVYFDSDSSSSAGVGPGLTSVLGAVFSSVLDSGPQRPAAGSVLTAPPSADGNM